MSPDGRRRSREHWTDAMEDGPPVAAAHTHRLPGVVRVALAGLVAAVSLLLIAMVLLAMQLSQVNEYVQGKGEQRDRERVALEQLMRERDRQAVCDLLDQFPEGGWLQRPRIKYGCGPGIPVSRLSPEEQRDLLNRQPAAVMPKPAPLPPAPPRPVLPKS